MNLANSTRNRFLALLFDLQQLMTTTFPNVGAQTRPHPCSPRFMHVESFHLLGGGGEGWQRSDCKPARKLLSSNARKGESPVARHLQPKGREGPQQRGGRGAGSMVRDSEGRNTAGMQVSREGSQQGVSCDGFRLPETGTGARREVWKRA